MGEVPLSLTLTLCYIESMSSMDIDVCLQYAAAQSDHAILAGTVNAA
jgi:hypothetical protein